MCTFFSVSKKLVFLQSLLKSLWGKKDYYDVKYSSTLFYTSFTTAH